MIYDKYLIIEKGYIYWYKLYCWIWS